MSSGSARIDGNDLWQVLVASFGRDAATDPAESTRAENAREHAEQLVDARNASHAEQVTAAREILEYNWSIDAGEELFEAILNNFDAFMFLMRQEKGAIPPALQAWLAAREMRLRERVQESEDANRAASEDDAETDEANDEDEDEHPRRRRRRRFSSLLAEPKARLPSRPSGIHSVGSIVID